MISVVVILILCADIWTTWYLLTRFHGRVYEANRVAARMFKSKFYGHLAFVMLRIALLAFIIQYAGFWGMMAWGAVTLYAVINNLLVIRRLHG